MGIYDIFFIVVFMEDIRVEGEERFVFLRWKNKRGICSWEIVWECYILNGAGRIKNYSFKVMLKLVRFGLISYGVVEVIIYCFLYVVLIIFRNCRKFGEDSFLCLMGFMFLVFSLLFYLEYIRIW